MSTGPVPKIPIGIGAPNVLWVPVTSLPTVEGGTDLTTVTGVTFRVFDPDGTEQPAAWTGALLSGATAVTLTTTYAFTGSEFGSRAGRWSVAPVLVVPGGSVPCEAVDIEISRIPPRDAPAASLTTAPARTI